MHLTRVCEIDGTDDFSLRSSSGPIAWAAGRSPRAFIIDRRVVILDREQGMTVARRIGQNDAMIRIESSAGCGTHEQWLKRTFRGHAPVPTWEDKVVESLAARFPGLRSYTDGSLFAGLVTSVVGQSVSIASAMSVQRRLALLFHEGVDVNGRIMAPLPAAVDLADASLELIRSSGVTWKRAEGLKAIAREAVAGNLPTGDEADLDAVQRELVKLPIVGPWTAASALLWGIGVADAWPKGDVALLRAARLAYDQDGMTMRDLDAIADGWRPRRAIAARLLWTGLLGPGWE